ncbi:MAG: hypothetical protein IIT61_03300 [Bacteroidales bacterium]|nr:hypothetical protein [Bacteroidales bacterium]MBQ2351517.1 hypothetical protein [Bacteroidales bacterium]MBQ2573972.1 hypothetical protein [Bacteroidales bacterium]MBQ5423933.1 hypothetical protein [Bacteroidales bacterium]MBQ5457730.1 hypothetical protein [Bacteroidales bacterium]
MEDLFGLLGALAALSFLSVLAAFILNVLEGDTVPSILSFLSLVFVIALGATVFVSIYKYEEERVICKTTEQVNICTDTLSIEKSKCDTTVQYILFPVYLAK